MKQTTIHRMHLLAIATTLALGSAASGAAFAGQANMTGLDSAQMHDQFIVKFRDGSATASSSTGIERALERAAGAALANGGPKVERVRRIATGAQLVRAGRGLDRAEAARLMRQIAADPDVEYVEIDRVLVPLATPNDTRYGEQWGYFDADAGIRANTAWDLTNGSGTIVAVLDTGITSHSDLNANVIAGYDFISDTFVSRDGDGRDSNASDPGDWNDDSTQCRVSNSSWHGTHVAGTVGAVTNNGAGVAGTAYGAKIVPVRVLGRCGGRTSDIADAIVWSSGGSVTGVPNITTRADVLNLSLGGAGTCDTTTQTAINGARSRGSVVVVAAGNSNDDATKYSPASCSGVITVASVTSDSARSSFSNYGSAIEVAAPGSNIVSTVNTGTTSPSTEGYSSMNGTSMASPHVAGVVALIQSRRKALGLSLMSPADIDTTLKNTAYPLAVACTLGCGAGIVDARKAVEAAGSASQTYTNGTDYSVPDLGTVDSPISIANRTGYGLSSTAVAVDIRHTFRGDLQIDLVAPDGSLYRLKSISSSDSADNVIQTFYVNLTSELKNGTWKLRVKDAYSGDTGYINSWSITM